MTETGSLLEDLAILKTFGFLDLDKDTQESKDKDKKIQDILLANKVNTLAILGEASWIASNNFELPDDFYRFYTNIPLDSETGDSIFQKHERAKKTWENIEYYDVRLKQDTDVGWFRQAPKQMMKILNFSDSSFQNISKSFEFSWDDENKQIKFIEKNDKKEVEEEGDESSEEVVNKGIVICLTESMTNNVKLGARLQYLWDNVTSAGGPDGSNATARPFYELSRQHLRNYLRANYKKEVSDFTLTILNARTPSENFDGIKFDDLKTLVESLGVDVTPPASRSSNPSIDEKLDALIYIQSELISLLKKKLL
jgi:hypothetical protein